MQPCLANREETVGACLPSHRPSLWGLASHAVGRMQDENLGSSAEVMPPFRIIRSHATAGRNIMKHRSWSAISLDCRSTVKILRPNEILETGFHDVLVPSERVPRWPRTHYRVCDGNDKTELASLQLIVHFNTQGHSSLQILTLSLSTRPHDEILAALTCHDSCFGSPYRGRDLHQPGHMGRSRRQ